MAQQLKKSYIFLYRWICQSEEKNRLLLQNFKKIIRKQNNTINIRLAGGFIEHWEEYFGS